VKEAYSNHKFGEWVDVKLIFYLNPPKVDSPTPKPDNDRDAAVASENAEYKKDAAVETENAEHNENAAVETVTKQPWHERQHKCELQIVHKLMTHARTDMGGHAVYNKYRGLNEAITALEAKKNTSVEFRNLQTQISTFLKTGTPGEIDQLSRMFHMENAITGSIPQGTAAQPLEDYLAQYPNLSLDDYEQDPNFWFINKDFPGLRMINKDPCIFLVPNLLSPALCTSLMVKAGPHVVQSKAFDPVQKKMVVGEHRTSWEVRILREEVPATQKIFSKLLHMPVENMGPLKVMRYKQTECFKQHYDASKPQELSTPCCPVPCANRAVTLFAYLNTPESGGETHFINYGLKIKPRAGMGVIHFPSYLNTAPYENLNTKFTVGAKVKWQNRNGIIMGGCNEKRAVSLKLDNLNFDSADNIELGGKQISDVKLIPHMKGMSDQRMVHEGMPATDEKFILSQWCWPGAYDYTKVAGMSSTKPLSDGIVL
jgi:hypothetical protein